MAKVTRDEIIKLIVDERLNQINDPNTFNDHQKTKNDWKAKAGYYLFDTAASTDNPESFEPFRQSLIKAGAIILAALETSYELENNKDITDLMSKLDKNND